MKSSIAMAGEADATGVEEEEVAKFLLNTCRVCPPPTADALLVLSSCAGVAGEHPADEPEADLIPLATGSVAEFRIETLLSCVGDADVMYHRSTELAMPAGRPPPTRLPEDFHTSVRLYEIIDSEWSGYVYLKLSGMLIECNGEGTYTASWCESGSYLSSRRRSFSVVHGPAILIAVKQTTEYLAARISSSIGSLDLVPSVRCLEWPPQAADWPTRRRKYGWPESATVDRVVSNGCDVVQVAHPTRKQVEWMRRHQWRLSFSRAEVVLLNSWMPVQQIVYHMLRVFVKSERLTDGADDSRTKTLSNYHIKTLMLWACEMKPEDWWTADSNFVRICTELLHTLAARLEEARCQHYFVEHCNLFHERDHSTDTASRRLTSVTQPYLSTWFIQHYVLVLMCAGRFPRNILRLLEDAGTNTGLKDAVAEAVNWRQNSMLRHCFWALETTAVHNYPFAIHRYSLTVPSTLYWIGELEKFDRSLVVYFIAIAFLHIGHRTVREGGLSFEMAEVLTTILLRIDGRNSRMRRQRSDGERLLRTASRLIQVEDIKSHILQRIRIEVSMALRSRALSCSDCDSDSIYCLANVHLAALYYATGQYQTAIDHCTLVTNSQDSVKCSALLVKGDRLPKIDDDIDNALGLPVLYQYVRNAALNQQQELAQQVNVSTARFFAYYLHVRCLSASKKERHLKPDTKPDVSRSCQLISDVLLLKQMPRPLFLDRSIDEDEAENAVMPVQSHKNPNLNEILLQSAVEHLTTFRQLEAREFGSVTAIVETDFLSLYAYKCGHYQPCLTLCQKNVLSLLARPGTAAVVTYPEFMQLMDNDIVSLVGLTLVVNPDCRGGADYIHATCVNQLPLSLYVLAQCELKLGRSVQSLKVTRVLVERTRKLYPANMTLNHLTLKLTDRILLTYLASYD